MKDDTVRMHRAWFFFLFWVLIASSCGKQRPCDYYGAWYSEFDPKVLHISDDSLVYFNLLGPPPGCIKGNAPECSRDFIWLEKDIDGNDARFSILPLGGNEIAVSLVTASDTSYVGRLYRGSPDEEINRVLYFPNELNDTLTYLELNSYDSLSFWSKGVLSKKVASRPGTLRELTGHISMKRTMRLKEFDIIPDDNMYFLQIFSEIGCKELQFSYGNAPAELIEIALYLEWIYMKDTYPEVFRN